MQQLGHLVAHIPDLIAAIKNATEYLADAIEIFAALIIGIAAIEGLVRALLLFWHRDVPPNAKEDLRLRLGRWLAVALEFELGADILRTAVAPSLQVIGQLAAIAAIRTALNFFLEREIQAAAARQSVSPTASPTVQQQQREQLAQHDQPGPPEEQRGSAA